MIVSKRHKTTGFNVGQLAGEEGTVPLLQQAHELKQFVEEIFAISKDFWTSHPTNPIRQEAELSEKEFATLDILTRADGPLAVGDIQRQIGILPAQMSRVIRLLESKDGQALISCSINQTDKRKIDVELTEAGRKAHHDYHHVRLGGIEKILSGLTAEDRDDLVRLVRKVRVHYLTHKLRMS